MNFEELIHQVIAFLFKDSAIFNFISHFPTLKTYRYFGYLFSSINENQ